MLTLACVSTASLAQSTLGDDELTPEEIFGETGTEPVDTRAKETETLRAQVLLERANFSPGEIDGVSGSNMRTAIAGFQKRHGLKPTGTLDEATWAVLNRDKAPILITYRILPEDVDYDFTDIPTDMMEKAELDELSYSSAVEALGEKFHASPGLLQQLNPGTDFYEDDQDILVPNVQPTMPLPLASSIVVDRSSLTVSLRDARGEVYAQYPATIGSKHDPLPIGNWVVNGVANEPTFHYNPKLFWDADRGHAKATIQPGPNNPVGVVWIDLSKEHYGIHGTPEPSNIGKTQSHGCIRLTNWSVLAVGQAVGPGTPAILQE